MLVLYCHIVSIIHKHDKHTDCQNPSESATAFTSFFPSNLRDDWHKLLYFETLDFDLV